MMVEAIAAGRGGFIAIALFLFLFILSSALLIRKQKAEPASRRMLAVCVHFVFSSFLTALFLRMSFFPNGDYYNYGAGGGLARFLFSVGLGLALSIAVVPFFFLKKSFPDKKHTSERNRKRLK